MNKHLIQGDQRSTKHTDIQQTPSRVAPRLKEEVKNKGTKEEKKEPKE